ncbi:MAG: hypothetical protein NC930_08745, partial [Candidatus Omnitrophica bacterium]|nr:hypothetical protein [Candidatus Omnitrophota bacterium]
RGYERADSLRDRGEKPYPVERVMRDVRINTVIEGTSQIMRLIIAREALDSHVNLIMPMVSPNSKIQERLSAFLKAVGFYSLWYPRQFIPRDPLPKNVWIPQALRGHMKYVGRTARRLARNVFHAMMIYQQKLEIKQQLMSRIVNIGTDLYAMSASCARAIRLCEANPSDPSPSELAHLFCLQARSRIEKQFRSLFFNHDADAYKVAQKVLRNEYAWLENDIIAPD